MLTSWSTLRGSMGWAAGTVAAASGFAPPPPPPLLLPYLLRLLHPRSRPLLVVQLPFPPPPPG
eukprot:COSAG02_NODE_71943_length_188_cov_314.595506_1_plen_62_part_11